MHDALNNLTLVVVNAAVVAVGAAVGNLLKKWANTKKAEAESKQVENLEDVVHIAVRAVEQWAKTEVKVGAKKPTSIAKLSLVVDWVCEHYPRLAKNEGQVRRFVDAAVNAMNEGK